MVQMKFLQYWENSAFGGMIARRLGIKQEGGIEMQVVGESIILPFRAQFYFMRADGASINNDGVNGNNFLQAKGKFFMRDARKLPAGKINEFRGADDRDNAVRREGKTLIADDDHRQRRQHKNRDADQNQHQDAEQRFVKNFLHQRNSSKAELT